MGYNKNYQAGQFEIPTTRKCRVVYKKDGSDVCYACIIDTPISTSALQKATLEKHIAWRQIVRLEPIQDLNQPRPFRR